ncbi:MAG TPA: HAMP domain-containing sensor histidine kinase [Streptosporangiaceae bacterium]|nr:HAMP domain-containing sensor histidine kinase [Streptosporangiaceae bacterium]
MFDKTNAKSDWLWMTGPEAEDADQSRRVPRARPGAKTLPSAGGERHEALSSAESEHAAVVALRTLRELCHDLTAPATSIKRLTRVAAAETDPGPYMRARLRQISEEASRIGDICGYFLDQPSGEGPADLDVLTADTADSTRWRYPGVIDVAADTVAVAAHPVVVVRILTNLIDSACRAAGPGGHVLLTVQRHEGRATLVVADSGRGLEFGSPAPTSLGLDIVAAMVRRSGGDLWMGPSDLGGMAVTVTLPRAGPGAADGADTARHLPPREVAG